MEEVFTREVPRYRLRYILMSLLLILSEHLFSTETGCITFWLLIVPYITKNKNPQRYNDTIEHNIKKR